MKVAPIHGKEIKYRKTILPNGIRVLTEEHPSNRAVSCGVWINKGTRDEVGEKEAGLAHYLEHMVFKRTARRNAYEIARDMEAVGGELNAFTAREYTSYVTHSLSEHVGLSIDVLSDLVCRPTFAPSDIRKEKQVVLQEIAMTEDQLEEAVFDRFFELAYPNSSLGTPILGTKASIEGMKRKTVADFHARQYTAPNIIVSVSGRVKHDEVLSLVLKHLKPPKGADKMAKVKTAKDKAQDAKRAAPELKGFREVIRKPSEQAHIVIGLPATDFCSPLRFEGYVVNTLLGGGMTSRLYQEIREERGLVYSIYSQLTTFTDSGMKLIYAGTEPKNAPTVVELVLKELKRLKKNGIKRADLELFKTQVKGGILLGADDIENRMNSLAINEMVFGRYRPIEDVIRDVDGVTLDSVQEYIEEYLDLERMGILLMGALPEAPTRKWLQQL